MKITESALREIIKEVIIEEDKKRPGLWANIHAKRKRGEKPAKPGDKDYPDKKTWKKLTKEAKMFNLKCQLVIQKR